MTLLGNEPATSQTRGVRPTSIPPRRLSEMYNDKMQRQEAIMEKEALFFLEKVLLGKMYRDKHFRRF